MNVSPFVWLKPGGLPAVCRLATALVSRRDTDVRRRLRMPYVPGPSRSGNAANLPGKASFPERPKHAGVRVRFYHFRNGRIVIPGAEPWAEHPGLGPGYRDLLLGAPLL